MTQPSRPYQEPLARLTLEPPLTFPSDALEIARRISPGSFETELGIALEFEGYFPEAAHYEWFRKGGHATHRQILARCYKIELNHLLRRGVRTDDREAILRFLEANPYFDGSGHLKEDMIEFLRRSELDAEDRARIESILRHAVLGGWKVSLPGWRRLTPLCLPAAVESIVREALLSERADVIDRGIDLLDRLDSQSPLGNQRRAEVIRRERPTHSDVMSSARRRVGLETA